MSQPDTTILDHLFRRLLTVVTSLLVIISTGWLIAQFYNLFVLLSMALILTYMLLWPVSLVEKVIVNISERLNHWQGAQWAFQDSPKANPLLLSVILVYFTFFLIAGLAAIKLAPVFSSQLQGFAGALPRYVVQVESILVDQSNQWLGANVLKQIFEQELQDARRVGVVPTESPDQIGPQPEITDAEKQVIHQSVLRRSVGQLVGLLEETASGAVNNVFRLVTGTLTGFYYFMAGALLIFYFLLNGREFHLGFLRIFHSRGRKVAGYFTEKFHEVMFAFVKGQVLLGGVTGVYMFFVLSVFNVQYAFFLSVFFALAEILPVVGTYIAMTPVFIVILFSDSPMTLLPVFLCSYCYQTIKDNMLAPKIVGDVMGLHPVVVILAIVLCAKLAGLVGILLALPLASVVNITLQYLFNPPEKTQASDSALEAAI
ncbi:MAG: AI-2E family transporter [Vampirovibrio sp.]|nr:AI-2E family transporter [Vampirovibrio sp.]